MLLATVAFMASGTSADKMGLMELFGQAEGTIIYGDRSAALVSAGGSKMFRAPFRGYIKSLTVQTDDGIELVTHIVIKINGKLLTGDNNAFEAGDTIEVIGTPVENAKADRIALELGTRP
jgi:hypothetical protein